MENKFVEAIEKEVAWKVTENGQTALNTTFDACLDLFSTIGALRLRTVSDIERKIAKAYAENKLVAMKTIFYARDIEEGLGERRVFRIALKYLASRYPEDILANMPNIAKYGRYDDLYELVGTSLEDDMFKYLKNVFTEDIKAYKADRPMTLLAKWLKSVNTSSEESRKLGKLTAKKFGMSEALYRKTLTKLRTKLDVVEKKMSAKEWEDINFSAVPGGAMKKYCAAFRRNQEERFQEYLDALKSGKTITVGDKVVTAKMNTKNLYPYEILEKYSSGTFYLCRNLKYNQEYEAMWDNLKNWLNGVESNTIIVADTSGSMDGRPMATSISLGIYFAERNSGPFKDKFMTFSSKPSWVDLTGANTLLEKIKRVPGIVENTNLEAAFDLILKTAVNAHLTQEDMPKNLVIITDMEFDSCVTDNSPRKNSYWRFTATDMTFYDQMLAKYARYGYKLPEITFWNVNARNDTYHTTAHKPHVRMVSGQATSVFRDLIDGKTHTPYDFMLEVLFKDRYKSVVISE